MGDLARRADTYVLVMNVRRSVVDRECPLFVVASGPCVARHVRSDHSFVRHGAPHRIPVLDSVSGFPLSGSIGRSRVSLWSTMVVRAPA